VRIYFARHGRSEANLLKVISNRGWKHPLTEEGRAQAAALAERLSGEGITHIYSSPVMRAVQTAEIVSQALGLPFTIEEALRENDNGSLEGRSDDAAWAIYDQAIAAWLAGETTARIADGETLEDIAERFEPFIHGLICEYGGTDARLLLVAHGGLYRAALPEVLEGIDRAFSWAHPLTYAQVVVAEERGGQLGCIQWDGADLRDEHGRKL